MILSKTLDPADFALLAPELAVVDRWFTIERAQHPLRRWEYALALRAYRTWGRRSRFTIDVGGAGSPFYHMVPDHLPHVLDPDCGAKHTLADYLGTAPPAPQIADAVFCLSVLEHVGDPSTDPLDEFCYHLACLVAPGGLLFLTMDYCDAPEAEPEDRYHFHWMRQRIFSATGMGRLSYRFLSRDFSPLTALDYTWHGPQVYDYTFASLALVKRP